MSDNDGWSSCCKRIVMRRGDVYRTSWIRLSTRVLESRIKPDKSHLHCTTIGKPNQLPLVFDFVHIVEITNNGVCCLQMTAIKPPSRLESWLGPERWTTFRYESADRCFSRGRSGRFGLKSSKRDHARFPRCDQNDLSCPRHTESDRCQYGTQNKRQNVGHVGRDNGGNCHDAAPDVDLGSLRNCRSE